MERYKIIKEVGNGTFGSVWRALNKQTGEIVAIKKMKKKYYSWEECINLREVKECNLYQLMKDRGKLFSEAEVRNWCFQVFQGLSYMQQRGYFHRDLKPENLLVSKDKKKFADFGLAREISSSPPYTEYVSTRWYRAPEVLLQSMTYGSAVDMWAMGAIMAELLTLRPLFPGSSEADEIYKICSVIGSPMQIDWAEGLELANAINYQFPQLPGVPLSVLIPSASKDAISLIASLCSWNPCTRPTALEALQHPFFQSCYYVPPSLRPKPVVAKTPPSAGTRVSLDQKCVRRYSGTLPNSKPPGIISSVKAHALLNTGVQRKLEMKYQDAPKNDKTLKSNVVNQPRYRLPARNSPTKIYTGKASELSDTSEKLASMTIGSGKQPVRQPMPPPMKAGGWNGQSDLRSQEIKPGRAYARKVAG